MRIAKEYLITSEGDYLLDLRVNLEFDNVSYLIQSPISASFTVYITESLPHPVVTWAQIASINRMSSAVNYKMFGSHHVYGATDSQFE